MLGFFWDGRSWNSPSLIQIFHLSMFFGLGLLTSWLSPRVLRVQPCCCCCLWKVLSSLLLKMVLQNRELWLWESGVGGHCSAKPVPLALGNPSSLPPFSSSLEGLSMGLFQSQGIHCHFHALNQDFDSQSCPRLMWDAVIPL